MAKIIEQNIVVKLSKIIKNEEIKTLAPVDSEKAKMLEQVITELVNDDTLIVEIIIDGENE